MQQRHFNDRFIVCVERVLKSEGSSYVNDPDDRGGPTRYGITIATLRQWRRQDVTEADVRSLTMDEAKDIYFSLYWNRVRADQLPHGLDYCVFDFAVNSGVRTASRALQRAVGGVKVDGIIGQQTLAAVASADIPAVIGHICDERLALLRSLPTFSKYGTGWTRRVASVRERSLADYRAFATMRHGLAHENTREVAAVASAAAGVAAVAQELRPVVETLMTLPPWLVYAVIAATVAGIVVWAARKNMRRL